MRLAKNSNIFSLKNDSAIRLNHGESAELNRYDSETGSGAKEEVARLNDDIAGARRIPHFPSTGYADAH